MITVVNCELSVINSVNNLMINDFSYDYKGERNDEVSM